MNSSWNNTNNHITAKTAAWSITRWLITLNILIFVIGLISPVEIAPNTNIALPQLYGSYSVASVTDAGQWWRLITYQFVHANLGHLVFNMFALWVFGTMMEKIIGSKKFILFYLLCGIAGALFSSALASFGLFDHSGFLASWRQVSMVGASGAIYGILAAAATIFPHQRIQLLFPPIELSMRNFALGLLILGITFIVFNWENAGGEAGHIGGMVMGFILIQLPWFSHRKSLIR